MAEARTEPSGARPVRSLDPHYYTDPAIFEREQRRIFFRSWQYAGHASELERPGDYVTFSLGNQDLLAIQGRDGAIRAFFNVCMHRAHRLVTGTGNCRTLVCPYHAWTYDLDGRLRGAPNHDKVPGFDKAGICLTEVRTEILCGFLFVNLDPDAEPMANWYPNIEAELRAHVPHIDRLKPLAWIETAENCNWKVSVENYNECYHCRINHPTFANGVVDPDSYNVLPQGHCLRHTTRAAHLDRMTYAIDESVSDHAHDYSSWFLWPAFSFQVYPGALLNTYLWRTDAVDRTTVYRGWYGIDGEPSDAVMTLAEQDRDTTVAEDVRLVNSVQRGLGNRGYRSGPLIIDPNFGVNSEHSIQSLQAWTLAALDD